MSAIHIPAEVGRTYLMQDGDRVRVTRTTAHTVTVESARYLVATYPRSGFEAMIESVLE